MLTRPFDRPLPTPKPPLPDPPPMMDVEVREIYVVFPMGYTETLRVWPDSSEHWISDTVVRVVRGDSAVTMFLKKALWYEERMVVVKVPAPKFTPAPVSSLDPHTESH